MRVPGLNSQWTKSSHLPIPKPINLIRGMKHDDWPVLNHMPILRLSCLGHTKPKDRGWGKSGYCYQN